MFIWPAGARAGCWYLSVVSVRQDTPPRPEKFGRLDEVGVAYFQDAAEEFGGVRIGGFDSCSAQQRQPEEIFVRGGMGVA